MKRTSEHQLTKDNAEAADDSSEQPQQFERAPPEVMARRRIVKARRTPNLLPSSANTGPNPFASLARPSPPAPAAQPDDNPENKPAEEDATKPTEHGVKEPENPVADGDAVVDAGETPAETPAKKTETEQPTEAEKPAEADKPAETLGEKPGDQPTQSLTENPAEPAKPPVQESAPPSGNTNDAAKPGTDTAPPSSTAGPAVSTPNHTNTKASDEAKPALAATDPTPALLKSTTPANGTAKTLIFGSATQPVSFASAAKTDAFNFKSAEPAPKVEEKKPEFKEAKVTTGEENDKELFRTRVKLYTLESAENGSRWKERGVGSLKLNMNTKTDKPRLLMRTEATLRVVLNTPVFKGFQIDRATDKSIRFQGFDVEDEKKTTSYLARFTTKDVASDMIAAIEKCKDGLE